MPHKGTIPTICQQCGTVYTVPPYKVATTRFCSNACRDASRRYSIECVCEQCGKAFKPANYTNSNRFCSRHCTGAHRSEQAERDTVVNFWARVTKTASCWVKDGPAVPFGYVRFKDTYAHIWAYEQASGQPVPRGMFVCHDCPGGDNPACVRNDTPGWKIINGVMRPKYGHLWLGASWDNTADMWEKGRHVIGEQCSFARLTEANVRAILAEYAAGGATYAGLAGKHGVSRGTVADIIKRRIWRHIT